MKNKLIRKISVLIFIAVLSGCKRSSEQHPKEGSLNDSTVAVEDADTVSHSAYVDPTGTYSFDGETEKKEGDISGYYGKIQVKKINKQKIAITFFICKGAPSYNSGSFIDTLNYTDNRGVYTASEYYPDCKVTFDFTEKGVAVKEGAEHFNSCGFGHGVVANGFFKKTSSVEPVLENPLTGRRIKTAENYELKGETTNTENVPEAYRNLFNVNLIGLATDGHDPDRKYYVDFSAVCQCEIATILIQPGTKTLYLFSYCSTKPSDSEAKSFEYDIKNIGLKNKKLVIKGTGKKESSQELTLVIGRLEDENVYSLETIGEVPGLWFEKYITDKKEMFEEIDCGDYDG